MTWRSFVSRPARARPSSAGHRPRGQATVEFGLTIGIVLLLFMAVIDFGRMVAMHAAAVTASREAARYGSAVGEVSPGLQRYRSCDDIREAARTVTRGLITLAESDIVVTYDSGPGTGVVASCPTTGGADTIAAGVIDSLDRVMVQVTLTYQPITPLGLVVDPITVVSTSRRTIVLGS